MSNQWKLITSDTLGTTEAMEAGTGCLVRTIITEEETTTVSMVFVPNAGIIDGENGKGQIVPRNQALTFQSWPIASSSEFVEAHELY